MDIILILTILYLLNVRGYLAQCDGTAFTVDLDPFEPLIFKYPQTGTYNQNLTCKWLFRSTKVSTFLSQVANSNVDCGDTLIIYNGNSTSSALESNGCSSSPGGTKIMKRSTQSDILLVFNTDDNTVSGTETGFDLRLISGYDISNSSEACVTRTTLTATSNIQFLTSPNFPQKVEKNMNCSWVITTEEPSANISIEIRFQDLDTYKGNCYDYINIIDAGVERMWCTRTKFVVETMESTGNTITVNFISGTYGPFHGFALSYRQNISTADTTTTSATSSTEPVTGQINQCNGDIQTIAMEMFKPLTFKYPDNGTYDQNLNCKWLFSSAPGSVIMFQVANSYVHCDDTLRTYDGNSTSSSVLLDNGCSNPPGGTKTPIVSTQNDILVYFTTDGTLTANTETGFDLPVISGIDMSNSGESCVSQTNLTATSHVQYLTSQNFPNKVVKNSKCTWVITAADSSANISIVLLFLDLDVYNGNCYDSLNIIDGGVKTQKCKRFSFPNETYTSESNTLTIQFTSGNFGPFHGFVLSYSQTDPADIATSADTTATSSAVTTDATVADKTSTSFTSTEIQTTTETYITTPATTQEADTSPNTTVSPTTTIPVSTATTSSPTIFTTTTTTLSPTTTKADKILYNGVALTSKDFFGVAPFTPAARIVLSIGILFVALCGVLACCLIFSRRRPTKRKYRKSSREYFHALYNRNWLQYDSHI